MEFSLDQCDKARLLLCDASDNIGSPLGPYEIETMALRIAFAMSVRSGTSLLLEKIANRSKGRPSLVLAKSLALDVRRHLKVGGIDPLFDLPAMLGDRFKIDIFPVAPESISGGCILFENAAFIFLSPVNGENGLFVCAHELGHLLLRARRSNSAAAVFDLPDKGVISVKSPHEHFADAFARELLIPSQGLGIALQEVRHELKISGGPIGDIELLYLSRIFGVGFLAVARRCEQESLLPEGGALTLYKFLFEKFGGPEKRAEMLELPPRRELEIPSVPLSIQNAALRLIEESRISRQETTSARVLPFDQTFKLA